MLWKKRECLFWYSNLHQKHRRRSWFMTFIYSLIILYTYSCYYLDIMQWNAFKKFFGKKEVQCKWGIVANFFPLIRYIHLFSSFYSVLFPLLSFSFLTSALEDCLSTNCILYLETLQNVDKKIFNKIFFFSTNNYSKPFFYMQRYSKIFIWSLFLHF